MRRVIRRTVLILASWAILNMGTFGWIKVCSSSGGRAGSGVSAMAQVDLHDDSSMSIYVLENEIRLGGSPADSEHMKAFMAVSVEPMILAAGALSR